MRAGDRTPPAGCTDPSARNYLRNAVIDDGTCRFDCDSYAETESFSNALCAFYDQATSEWQVSEGWQHGLYDGSRDVDVFTEQVIPILQKRCLFRTEYTCSTLRDHYGLDRPAA